MILIADSGSTKTDWVLRSSTDDGTQPFKGICNPCPSFQTQGLNPIHMTDGQIAAILATVRQWLVSQLSSEESLPYGGRMVGAIQFYGSGVRSDQEERMERLLREAFLPLISPTPNPSPEGRGTAAIEASPMGGGRRGLLIEVHSDLLGAARALCGDSEGIACILGTGANSCLYDGQHIVANTPPLGYILGDEGSGAVLGIRFLNALYKGHLSDGMKNDFEAEMQMTLSEVIERVYRQPLPNRWLASLSPFIHSRLGDLSVENLVVDNFHDFIIRNIDPYRRKDLPLQAVGSIAFFYKDQLCKAAKKAGYAVGKVLRSPLDNII